MLQPVTDTAQDRTVTDLEPWRTERRAALKPLRMERQAAPEAAAHEPPGRTWICGARNAWPHFVTGPPELAGWGLGVHGRHRSWAQVGSPELGVTAGAGGHDPRVRARPHSGP